jgi:hypothetical protein
MPPPLKRRCCMRPPLKRRCPRNPPSLRRIIAMNHPRNAQVQPLPLPPIIPPDIFMPSHGPPHGSGGSSPTTIPQLQLLAAQCLLGSTSFAASCVEQCAASENPSPPSLLLASFYSQMLVGGAGSLLTLSCSRLLTHLVALHPQDKGRAQSMGNGCDWVSCLPRVAHVLRLTLHVTGECLALLSGHFLQCCSPPSAPKRSDVCQGWRCCPAGRLSHVICCMSF